MQKYLSKSEYTNNNIDCYCINCELNRIFEYTNCEVREDTGVIRMNTFDEQSVQNMFPCIGTGIVLILDDVLAEKKRPRRKKLLKNLLLILLENLNKRGFSE